MAQVERASYPDGNAWHTVLAKVLKKESSASVPTRSQSFSWKLLRSAIARRRLDDIDDMSPESSTTGSLTHASAEVSRFASKQTTQQLLESMRDNLDEIESFEERFEAFREKLKEEEGSLYATSPRMFVSPSTYDHSDFDTESIHSNDYSSTTEYTDGTSYTEHDASRYSANTPSPLSSGRFLSTMERRPLHQINIQLDFTKKNMERSVRGSIRRYKPNRSQEALARKLRRAAHREMDALNAMAMKSASARNSEASDSDSDSSYGHTTRAVVKTAPTDYERDTTAQSRLDRNLNRMDSMVSMTFDALHKFAQEQLEAGANDDDDESQETDSSQMFDEERHFEILKAQEEAERLKQISTMKPVQDVMENFKTLKSITQAPTNVTESLIINRPKRAGFCQTRADAIILQKQRDNDVFFLNGNKVILRRRHGRSRKPPEKASSRRRVLRFEDEVDAFDVELPSSTQREDHPSQSAESSTEAIERILQRRPSYSAEPQIEDWFSESDNYSEEEEEEFHPTQPSTMLERPSTAPIKVSRFRDVLERSSFSPLERISRRRAGSAGRDRQRYQRSTRRRSMSRLAEAAGGTYHDLRKSLKSVSDFPDPVTLAKRPASEDLVAPTIARSIQNWLFINDVREQGASIVERAKKNLTREQLRENYERHRELYENPNQHLAEMGWVERPASAGAAIENPHSMQAFTIPLIPSKKKKKKDDVYYLTRLPASAVKHLYNVR